MLTLIFLGLFILIVYLLLKIFVVFLGIIFGLLGIGDFLEDIFD